MNSAIYKRSALVALALNAMAFAQPAKFASFEMSRPDHKPEEVVVRAYAAAQIMTGQRFFRPPVAAPAGAGRTQLRVSEKPDLEITWDAAMGELRIVDTQLSANAAAARDMSQDEAVKLAKRTFDQLAAVNLLDQRQFDWRKADVASTWIGGGVRGGPTLEKRRIEYRVTVRRSINGIEMANAGVRIAVHTSGRVASLRLGGVSVASAFVNGVEEPTGTGRWLTAQGAPADLQARLQRSVLGEKPEASANMRIVWQRLMYVMPENKRTDVVAPLHVVSYSLVYPSDDGQVVVSRRKTVGFSLVDPAAAPLDLTPSERAPEVDRQWKAAL